MKKIILMNFRTEDFRVLFIILKINVFAIMLFSHSYAIAQDILWERSYGGKHAEYLLDMQPTADYGFILAGASLSLKSGNKENANNGDLDYYIWKMNENGDQEWQKTIGGSGQDLLYSIKSTKDGGFILAGTSKSGISYDKKEACLGKEDIWIIKLNAKGNEDWQITLGGPAQDLVKTIEETSDGGFVVGGSSASPASLKLINSQNDPLGKSDFSKGGLDFWIVRLDHIGKLQWQSSLGGEYADILEFLTVTDDGGCIVGGYSNSPASVDKAQDSYGQGDYWVIKMDKDGNIEWENIFGGEQDDHLYSILKLQDGAYLVGGSSNSSASGNKTSANGKGTDLWLLKIDNKGGIIWQKTFDIGTTDLLSSMVVDSEDSIIIGAYAQSEVIGKIGKKDKKGIDDYVALKLTQEGDEIWRQAIGSAGEDRLKKVIELRDGGYILAGSSKGDVSRDRSSGFGSEDFWVVKLLDKSRKKNFKQRPKLEAIPNPTAQFSNVLIGFNYNSGTVSVFDLSGRELQNFAINGERTVPIDLQSYPTGVYLVEIRTNNGAASVKILRSSN